MSSSTPQASFWRGFRNGLPFLIVVAPFGLLFGVVGTEAGLDLTKVMAFSILVIAGASQFTALQLMQDQTPTLIVLISALAVNLRMAMYSASLAPHLGSQPIWRRALLAYVLVDQTYAASSLEYERRPTLSPAEKIAYAFGVAASIAPGWYGATLAGALLGTTIPDANALDFAVPITFLAIIAPALRTLAHVAAAGVSVVAALLLQFLPYNLWLPGAAVLAMMTGAQVELWLERRK